MPKVIVNTSPLQYLFQLNKMDTLNQVYESITVPLCVQLGFRISKETYNDILLIARE
ncbi:MAG: hypothetical protein IPQ05_10065 [Leptospiraceae bacterium]|nr:hypothetical protein [Leptospiraceae bacterium]MBL0264206.1 hypothetical protein [Leptospiraceae bacterium]